MQGDGQDPHLNVAFAGIFTDRKGDFQILNLSMLCQISVMEPENDTRIELSEDGSEIRLLLTGKCSHSIVDALQKQAMKALHTGKDVVIDGPAVEHVHASVAQVLVALGIGSAAAGRQARIAAGADAIRSALSTGGMAGCFAFGSSNVGSISEIPD